MDLIDPQDYSKAVDVRSIKQSGKIRGRALTLSEIAALMQSCSGKTPIDVRDSALIAILRGGGIRRGEAVNLDLRDFNPSTRALFIREGKGKKDRTVYLPEPACSIVEEWLELRGDASGPLLYPIRKLSVTPLFFTKSPGELVCQEIRTLLRTRMLPHQGNPVPLVCQEIRTLLRTPPSLPPETRIEHNQHQPECCALSSID